MSFREKKQKLNKRYELFDIFTQNLTINYQNDSVTGLFLCPTCEEKFEREACRKQGRKDPLLSIAHIWPDALGGSEVTLSCKKCNSNLGSNLEKHEVERVKTGDSTSFNGRIAIPNVKGQVPVRLQVLSQADGSQHLDFNFDEERGHPKIHKALKRPNKGRNVFTFKWRQPFDDKRADVSLLYGAYLSAFQAFGYSFYFTEAARRMRVQIHDPKGEHYPFHIVDDVPIAEDYRSIFDKTMLGVTFAPATSIGLAVLSKSLSVYKGQKIIFLPFVEDVLVKPELMAGKDVNLEITFDKSNFTDLTVPGAKTALLEIISKTLKAQTTPYSVTFTGIPSA